MLDSPLRRNPHAQFTLSRYLWKTEEYRDMLTRQHWFRRFTTRAHRSYLNEVEELALGGMVPRRPWLAAFFGRGA